MQTISVNFLGHLARHIGSRVVDVAIDDPPTVANLLSALQARLGSKFSDNFMKDGELEQELVVLLINGLNLKQCAKDGQGPLDVHLKESDDITFIVQFGGG
ncbi:MAG: MoaD/ThiS family protein [Candidatus Lokiarchaeota archaeon]|nr:MoaD/ThiS family protein [Candidatus Lokiarchaeota archaeon]